MHAQAARGLAVVMLRPARIYGPFSRTFTVRPLTALRAGRLVLAGDADSPSNMVYVDNVVEAILLALDRADAVRGEAFLIAEPDQLSWSAFFEYFAAETGATVHVEPPGAASPGGGAGWFRQWSNGARGIAFSPEVRALAKKVMWTDPFGVWPRRLWETSPALQGRILRMMGVDQAVVYREPPPASPFEVRFRIAPTLVASDSAMERLGYQGRVRRGDAMGLTRDWARDARLL